MKRKFSLHLKNYNLKIYISISISYIQLFYAIIFFTFKQIVYIGISTRYSNKNKL